MVSGSRGARERARAWAAPSLACALALGAAACAPESDGFRVAARLVDPGFRAPDATTPRTLEVVARRPFPTHPGSMASLPTATIADDTRLVLAAHPNVVLTERTPIVVGADRRLALTLAVPHAMNDAPELVLQPQVRGLGRRTAGWTTLAATVAPVVGHGDARSVDVETPIDLPEGTALEVHVVAYRPPGTPATECASLLVDLPTGGSLDVAFGVLDAARRLGPVGFGIDVCDEARRCTALLDETLAPATDGPPHWHERRVALGSHGGRRRSFRFRTTDPTGRSLPVWGHPTILAPAPPHTPNVILVSIDTLRRDHLDLYGYARRTAPFLHDFATRGTVFDRLVAEAATTAPSHMTIFTSLPALVHGVTGGAATPKVPVATVAEAFRAAGYRTAAFTEDGPLAHERGFALGFDEYTENKSALLLSPSGQVDRTFGQVRAWLARHADEPFFVFAHTFQVHAPYAPPKAYAALFADAPPTPADPRATEPARNYDREIRYVDDELRSLVGWLEARHLVERTLLVVTADHGEEFYEHGSLGHGTLPWEEVLRVPLVMVGPGIPAGRREPTPAHHLDLMPTLLALAGIPAPERLYGRNVAAWTENADPRSGRDPLFSASWALPAGLLLPAVAVRLGDAKLVRHRDARGEQITRLFDLRADPAEQNVIRDPEAERALGRLLDEWAADTASDARRRRGAVPAPAAARPALDPARENKLLSLGYVE